jgi:hypothetical protein
VLLLWAAAGALAAVNTILEPRLIDEMESVRLTIRAAGAGQLESPDLSALEKDFEILGSQTSSRISTINGRTTAIIEYQINLRPRRTGELIVPPIRIGSEYSEEVRLAVRPLDPGVRKTIERMIFFETEFTENPVYVQAQTILVRRLFYSNGVQIYSDLPGIPEVANAVVVPLGDTRSSSSILEGQRYGVIEQRFAIFPEQSGRLTIPAISVTSSVRLKTGGRTRRSGIRVNTQAMDLEVLPIPAAYPADQAWLPAQEVVLSHSWSPDAAQFEIGQPVTLNLNAVVTGNVDSAIPPLLPALPASHFKVYPEAPELDESTSGDSIVGQRRESFALIPTAPGLITAPPITLTWWDTRAHEVRTSTLPERLIRITGTLAPTPAATAAANAQLDPVDPQPDASPTSIALVKPVLLGLLVCAAAILTFLGYRYRGRFLPHALPAGLRPTGRRRRRRELWNALARACRGSNPREIKPALARYLALTRNCSASRALADFRANPVAAGLLKDLDQSLYADSASANPQINTADLLALARLAGKPSRARQRYCLPELYSRQA